MFWRLIYLMIPIPFVLLFMETYNTQSNVTPEYQATFSIFNPVNNLGNRSLDRPMAEKILYWGKDMWLWQHWVRKGLLYPIMIFFIYCYVVSLLNNNCVKLKLPHINYI